MNFLARIKRLFIRKSKESTQPENLGFSVAEIAEGIGAMHSEVEQTLRELQKKGVVKIYYYQGQIYAVSMVPGETLDKLIEQYMQGDDVAYR